MNHITTSHEEAIERAEVLTCCRPPAIVTAVQARVVAHDHQYLLHRLDVRQEVGAYQLTIHGHLYHVDGPDQPLPLLIEHFTITDTDEDGWVRSRESCRPGDRAPA